ncbi:MAG: hypothetical protein HY332_08525 [Chloroflexi bacterium]|nr:hypothetical protein [Chloroflexota bacterium]
MKLGVDSFSLRWQGWDAFGILEYAARLGLDNVHFSERGNLASLDEDYLASLKRRADELGLTIEVGMLSFDEYSRLFKPELASGVSPSHWSRRRCRRGRRGCRTASGASSCAGSSGGTLRRASPIAGKCSASASAANKGGMA